MNLACIENLKIKIKKLNFVLKALFNKLGIRAQIRNYKFSSTITVVKLKQRSH